MCVWLGQLFVFLYLLEKLSDGTLIEQQRTLGCRTQNDPPQKIQTSPKGFSFRLVGELLFSLLRKYTSWLLEVQSHILSLQRTYFILLNPSQLPFISPSPNAAFWITVFTVATPPPSRLPRVHSRAHRNSFLFRSEHTNLHGEVWIYVIHRPNFQLVYISSQNMASSVSKIN